ncbi:hypothetical protein BJ085DRAFT_10807, partial [Dimargaris cristalligena]
ENFDPERFVTSNIVGPRFLFYARLLIALYSLATIVVMFVTSEERFFWYMTSWSFFGLTIYFALATFISWRYCFGPLRFTEHQNPLARVSTPVRAAYWFLYESVAVLHLLVPIVFWALLSSAFDTSTSLTMFSSIGPHATDFFLMATEVLFNRQLLQLSHMVVLLIVLALYLALAYLVWGATQVFVYSFLNFHKLHGYIALVVLAMGVFCCLLFLIQYFVHRGRDYVFRRRRAVLVV